MGGRLVSLTLDRCGRGPPSDARPYARPACRDPLKLAKKHGPTVFLLVMVSIMVVVMSLVLGFVNGAFAAGFWAVWPRQFAIAFVVALPAAYFARKAALAVVARVTE
jgi:hypothetical protein